MTSAALPLHDPDPALLTETALHADGDPHLVWRWMRRNAPVHFHHASELPAFWSLTRHEDIKAVYRDPQTFSSEQGVLLRPARQGDDPGGGMTLALSDPPRHRLLRGLMADWFSTRAVRGLEGTIAAAVDSTLDRAFELGDCDAVHDIAGRLSHTLICRIMGVPEQDHDRLLAWTDEAFEAHTSLVAHPGLLEYFSELLFRRMEEPADDLMSALVHGTVQDRLLTEEEALLNCENLIGATENGRLALVGGVLALLRHPEQLRRLDEDRALLPGAVEEILRWTSSAVHSMRTATRDCTLRGQRIRAGQRVVLWLPSADRDEEVFADPDRFDIARRPNRHIALAAGEHYCIGATLARAQMRRLLTGLLDRAGDVAVLGPAPRVRSIAVAGPRSLPLRFTPKRRRR
ncbi:cytochrome P450 [Nocardiopsis baichengensis]|uniref:cytochrome P450 n=1 Tax=Nocardiopsis baichengensis TaxID=280240 RepID=UPI0003455FF1|nr:cytochrome P450 [Nocardiopsis baichengensis]